MFLKSSKAFSVSLTYLTNFWRSLHLLLIKCEIEFGLTWSKNYIISEISRTRDVGGGNPVQRTLITGATFQINSTKLYVPVVTLSTNHKIKFLENLKQEFRRTISWNKYRSEITTQPKNNNLDFMTDPIFRDINRPFVLLFKNGDNDPTRASYISRNY